MMVTVIVAKGTDSMCLIGPVLGCMRVFPCTCDDIGRCDMVLRTHGGRICLMEGTNEL